MPRRLSAVLLGALLLTGCSGSGQGSDVDPDQIDSVDAPELGACRVLTPDGKTTSFDAGTIACSAYAPGTPV